MEESAAVRKGGQLFGILGCRRCHVSGGKGNRLSSDLDTLPFRSPPERIAEAIRLPAYYMPDFRLGEDGIAHLVNAILAASSKREHAAGETPVRVHFEEEGGEDVFARHCGPCHKALSARHGGLGKGIAGPNLSALFSPHYPKTGPGGKPWTVERLRAWIANPRNQRPSARMPPLRLKEEELLRIVERLDVPRLRSHPLRGSGRVPPAAISASQARASGSGRGGAAPAGSSIRNSVTAANPRDIATRPPDGNRSFGVAADATPQASPAARTIENRAGSTR
jgi:cytochrome c2